MSWVALVWVLCTLPPVTFVLGRAAIDARWIDSHSLCCRPSAPFLFVVLPLVGAGYAARAMVRIGTARGALTGWLPAAVGVVLGPLSAAGGYVLWMILRS